MSKIRYSEYFLSIQGEGRFVGVPSVFLRLYGCNFECPGFGQQKGNLIPRDEMPWKKLDVSQYKSIDELPIMPIGCDSSASWAKEYMHLTKFKESIEIANLLKHTCPGEDWIHPGSDLDTHLVITGGEPLLWQKQLPDLLEECRKNGLENLTFETNATQKLAPKFYDYLVDLSHDVHITWSCSPKLTISGEKWEDAIKPANWSHYKSIPNSHLYLKFVVGDEDDIDEVDEATADFFGDVYLMPVGGTEESLALTSRRVCDLALERGYRYSPRLHVDLFGNCWGT